VAAWRAAKLERAKGRVENMALIKCKECGSDVSTAAKACTHCGAKPSKPVGVIGWALVLIVGFSIYQCTARTTSAPSGTTAISAAPVAARSIPPQPVLSDEERKKRVLAATEGLISNRDEMEKVSFFQAKKRNLLSSRIEAYISLSDGTHPYLRVHSNYHGDDWVFYDTIKVMADETVIYEKKFARAEVLRNHASGAVWETADYLAREDDLAALKKIAAASRVTIRFSGRERQHDHKVTKQEASNIKKVIDAYEAMVVALGTS
jgi:hypothetical protein